jgi:hypothetical protein
VCRKLPLFAKKVPAAPAVIVTTASLKPQETQLTHGGTPIGSFVSDSTNQLEEETATSDSSSMYVENQIIARHQEQVGKQVRIQVAKMFPDAPLAFPTLQHEQAESSTQAQRSKEALLPPGRRLEVERGVGESLGTPPPKSLLLDVDIGSFSPQSPKKKQSTLTSMINKRKNTLNNPLATAFASFVSFVCSVEVW